MKNSKNKRTTILIIILLGLLLIAYKVIFMPGDSTDITDTMDTSDILASSNAGDLLAEIESINFDTSIINDQSFQSFKSIETPLISLPVGKSNPFSSPY